MTETFFTTDAGHNSVEFHDDAPGIEVDGDDVSVDWDEVATVRLDEPPHANAFDSKEFHKLPATVARPIPQPYQYGEDTMWLKKPREELKKAAWSLDNAPWTLGHPETGMVKDKSDVRGFWSDPRYIDGTDELDADLYVPVNDDEAKEYVESHQDVSVGFYHRRQTVEDYDGVVGGSDSEDVELDGYQTDLLIDHCASVPIGRCSSEEGCGLDSPEHGHTRTVADRSDSFKWGTDSTDEHEDVTESDTMGSDPEESADCGCGGDENTEQNMDIGFDDLSAEAALAKLESQNDAASERLDELREATDAAEAAQEAADELDIDDVQDLADAVSMLQDSKEELEQTVDELRRPQMEEDAEAIAERTDRFGEDADEVIENLDGDAEAIAEKRELVEDLSESYDDVTANGGDDSEETESTTDSQRGYAKTPWE